jgi:rifampin ADP-ribosylating transferase
MQIDPENKINKLCGDGMMLEGEGKPNEAAKLFQQAWAEAITDQEKFTAAHYVARHQESVADKLKWDQIALELAIGIGGDAVKDTYPSLYLNVAKGHEDLDDLSKAYENYSLALRFSAYLPEDGYGNMIKAGINKGMERIQQKAADIIDK